MYKSVESNLKWDNSGWTKVQFVLFDVVEIIFEGVEKFGLYGRGVSCDANEEIYGTFEEGSI